MPMTKINWQNLKFNMVYKPIQKKKNVQYGWLREMMISSS